MSRSKPRNGGSPSGVRVDETALGRASAQVRIPKASEIVAGHIRRMILRGELAEGDKLASENQMVANFGISRPTLREAFRILESEHFISINRGSRSGPMIHKPRAENVARYAGFALQAEGTTLAEIYAARVALEPYAVRQLAANRPAKSLKKLRDEIARVYGLIEVQDLAEFHVTVARLHRTLIAISENRALILFIDLIEEIIELFQSRIGTSPRLSNSAERKKSNSAALKSFEKLVNLIEAGDGEGAEAHWRSHLENANAAWLAGVDQTMVIDILG